MSEMKDAEDVFGVVVGELSGFVIVLSVDVTVVTEYERLREVFV